MLRLTEVSVEFGATISTGSNYEYVKPTVRATVSCSNKFMDDLDKVVEEVADKVKEALRKEIREIKHRG